MKIRFRTQRRFWRELLGNEHGAEIVEMALVLVPMLGVLLLTIDASWAIFARASLQFAAREGCRYAVTGQTMSGLGQDASIRSVMQQNSFGFIRPDQVQSEIAINYFQQTPGGLVPTMSNAGGNIVQIIVSGVAVMPLAPVLQPDGTWSSAGLTFSGITSSDVMESSPGGLPPAR